MSDEKMREAFEALYSIPPMTQWSMWHKEYVPALQSMADEARTYTSMFYAFCVGMQTAQRQGGEAEPREFWVLFDARADKKFIKKDPEGGGLAFFDNERDAVRAKRHHTNTDYKKVTYYSNPQPAVPEGWKLVPVEPTKGMLNQAADNLCGKFGINYVAPKEDFAKAAYREFVEAAPKPPEDV